MVAQSLHEMVAGHVLFCLQEAALPWHDIPKTLVTSFPLVAPLDLVAGLNLAAGYLDVNASAPDAAALWRISALLAGDVGMMRHLSLPSDKAEDLLTYWSLFDPFFLAEPDPDA